MMWCSRELPTAVVTEQLSTVCNIDERSMLYLSSNCRNGKTDPGLIDLGHLVFASAPYGMWNTSFNFHKNT